jgi:serine palmitoyltransferase
VRRQLKILLVLIYAREKRLSGQGYCYSASLPAMLAVSANEALTLLEQNPSILKSLRSNVKAARQCLQDISGIKISPEEASPIIHIWLAEHKSSRWDEEAVLQKIVNLVN